MKVVDIREAKAQLSKLVDEAVKGQPFIIAKNGKPLVKVTAVDGQERKEQRRLGFLEGQFSIPEDFDTMCAEEIEEMFYGSKQVPHEPSRKPTRQRTK